MYKDTANFAFNNPTLDRHTIRLFGSNETNNSLSFPLANWQQEFWFNTPEGVDAVIYSPSTDRLYRVEVEGGARKINWRPSFSTFPNLLQGSYLISNSDLSLTGILGENNGLVYIPRITGTDWYEVNPDLGTETVVPSLPLGARTVTYGGTSKKTVTSFGYTVSVNPQTGIRTTVLPSGRSINESVTAGKSSIDATNDFILVSDNNRVYVLFANDLEGQTINLAKEDYTRDFLNFAQMPAIITELKILASSIQQLAEEVVYGSIGNNFSKRVISNPISSFSAHTSQTISSLKFPNGQAPQLHGDAYLEMILLPNSSVNIHLKVNRVANGLQRPRYS